MRAVYLAARYSRRDELRDYAAELKERKYYITSRWLFKDHRLHENEDVTVRSIELAVEDVQDVMHADVVVHFTEEPRTPTRGGRHFEMGMAYGLRKRVVCVGDREHVFMYLPEVTVYEDWAACRDAEFVARVDEVPERR